jgi:hypothetical protein
MTPKCCKGFVSRVCKGEGRQGSRNKGCGSRSKLSKALKTQLVLGEKGGSKRRGYFINRCLIIS